MGGKSRKSGGISRTLVQRLMRQSKQSQSKAKNEEQNSPLLDSHRKRPSNT